MAVAEGCGVFLSYRRRDSSHVTGRLYDRLAEHFGEDHVFMDVDTIEPGVDFRQEVRRAVAKCDVLLAIIGPRWLTASDASGRRRLADPDDMVRLEIEVAFARGVRVIPVLVEEAAVPDPLTLPPSLAELPSRQAFIVRHDSFGRDADQLLHSIERTTGLRPLKETGDQPLTPAGHPRWRLERLSSSPDGDTFRVWSAADSHTIKILIPGIWTTVNKHLRISVDGAEVPVPLAVEHYYEVYEKEIPLLALSSVIGAYVTISVERTGYNFVRSGTIKSVTVRVGAEVMWWVNPIV